MEQLVRIEQKLRSMLGTLSWIKSFNWAATWSGTNSMALPLTSISVSFVNEAKDSEKVGNLLCDKSNSDREAEHVWVEFVRIRGKTAASWGGRTKFEEFIGQTSQFVDG